MINEGWVCPKCGRVLAPNTMYCLWCCSGRGTTTNTASGTPESYLAKSLRFSRDGHEIDKTESNSEIPNNSTISKMEQVDKDINVRSNDEPHIVGKHADVVIIDDSQLTAKCLNCNNAKACKEKHWDGCVYEPQTERSK